MKTLIVTSLLLTSCVSSKTKDTQSDALSSTQESQVHRVYCQLPSGFIVYDGAVTGLQLSEGFVTFYPNEGARQGTPVHTNTHCIITPFNSSLDQRRKPHGHP